MTDPLFIDASAGSPAYSSAELRRGFAVDLQYNGRVFGARQGVRPGGNALQTSLAGSTITVRSGNAVVDPGLTTTQGPYRVSVAADFTGTLTAAHATLDRKDITVLRVYDNTEDSSGSRTGVVEYIAGTASGTPVEPSVPAGSFRLATIDVPHSGGGSPVVTLNFPWTVAAGGTLPVRNQTERDAIVGFDGFSVYRQDRDWVEIYDGAAWRVQGTAVCSSTTDRDSAITNPFNGQFAVTNDTGTKWRYNGSAWTRYPNDSASDFQVTSGTTGSTSYTTTLSGGTACGFAVTAPPSGILRIFVTAQMSNNVANYCFSAPQVRTGGTIGSGTLVLGANDDEALCMNGTVAFRSSVARILPGLTPGAVYNIQMLHKVGGGTGTFTRKILEASAA